MKNKELIERNTKILKEITSDEFLKKEYFESNDNVHKEQVLNLIKAQKSYLEKYKNDYEDYFILERITDNVVWTWLVWILFGIVFLLADIISSVHLALPLSLKNIFIIIALGFITPSVLCFKIVPSIKGKNTYKDYLENLKTKLEIIKNDRLEKGIIEDKPKVQDKKINDSFVKIMKYTIMKIKSLEYADKNKDLLKIKEISEEYFAILRKELALDSTTINLTTNGDIIALQNKLIEIENDAVAKAKIDSDERVLASELGPITTLDRSSVELDTSIDSNSLNLNRKLDIK